LIELHNTVKVGALQKPLS